MDHQQLFDRWIKSERALIDEVSGSIQHDLDELHREASEYAAENGLTLEWDGSWLGY